MSKRTSSLVAIAAMTVSTSVFAQINGSLDASEYGSPLAVQTVNTGFGNNQSELNAAYGRYLADGSFRLLLTGNLEGGGNGIVTFIDSRSGGAVASTLPGGLGVIGSVGGARTDDWGSDINGDFDVTPPPGGPSILDPGFNPEISFETNSFLQAGETRTNYYINIIDMTVPNEPNDNRDVYLGTNFLNDPAVTQTYFRDSGATNAGDVTHAFNNTNTAGVDGYDGANPTALSDPLTSTTGYEIEFSSLFLRAAPLQTLKLLPFITNGGGDFLANQFLPGLPGSPNNLGGPGDIGGTPLFDSQIFAGNQYIEVALPTYTGGNGNYGSTAWNYGVAPNGINASAVFGTGTGGGGTVTLNTAVTLGGLRFAGANTYNLIGSNTLTLNTYGDNARIDATAGSHTVSAPVSVQKNLEASASAGAGVTLSNISYAAGVTLTKTGDGRVTVNAVPSSVTINGGRLATTGGPHKVTTLAIATGATLDITNSAWAVDYTAGNSPLAAIRSAIIAGRNGGNWGGTGITSSTAAANASTTAIGYSEASDLSLSNFPATGGVPVDSTTVVFRYTRLGDANLSGNVSIQDFALLASGFGQPGNWNRGDFNYDGTVNINDFALLASNFGQSAPADLPRGAAVPEPASMALLGLAATALLARRRK